MFSPVDPITSVERVPERVEKRAEKRPASPTTEQPLTKKPARQIEATGSKEIEALKAEVPKEAWLESLGVKATNWLNLFRAAKIYFRYVLVFKHGFLNNGPEKIVAASEAWQLARAELRSVVVEKLSK